MVNQFLFVAACGELGVSMSEINFVEEFDGLSGKAILLVLHGKYVPSEIELVTQSLSGTGEGSGTVLSDVLVSTVSSSSGPVFSGILDWIRFESNFL
jgi:hypothetical protein